MNGSKKDEATGIFQLKNISKAYHSSMRQALPTISPEYE
jgi:hypothetical protein